MKPLVWIASSKKDLLAMPGEVRDVFGYAVHPAQIGLKSEHARPLKEYGSAGVLEVVETWKGDTYRAVYTAGSAMQSMCCTASRRRRPEVLRRRSRTWT